MRGRPLPSIEYWRSSSWARVVSFGRVGTKTRAWLGFGGSAWVPSGVANRLRLWAALFGFRAQPCPFLALTTNLTLALWIRGQNLLICRAFDSRGSLL